MASYYKSGVLTFGALLFGASQLLRFIQLFRDAAARKAANQAPPENYTAAGITWAALTIVVIACICLLLIRNRQGRLRMAKSRAYLLLSVLLSLWGVYYFITFIIEMARNSELTLLFDIAAIAAGIVVPVVLLQISDITEQLADDATLLICGAGGTALSVVSIIVLILLRKGYANAQLLLVTEFMFRIAMALCSLAALLKAIQLRNSYPIPPQEATPIRPREREYERERAPRPARRPREDDAPFTLRFDDEEEPYPDRRPARPKLPDVGKHAERHVQSLLTYAEQDFVDERPARPMQPARGAQQPTWDTGRIIVQGGTGRIRTQDPGAVPSERQTCPYCGKRMPLGFPNCPRCGRDM